MSENGATQRRVLRLDPRDNALVALADLRKGEAVKFAGSEYVLLSDVPAKHKFVTEELPAGGEVTMYGGLVGRTPEPLRRGAPPLPPHLPHASPPVHPPASDPRPSPRGISPC